MVRDKPYTDEDADEGEDADADADAGTAASRRPDMRAGIPLVLATPHVREVIGGISQLAVSQTQSGDLAETLALRIRGECLRLRLPISTSILGKSPYRADIVFRLPESSHDHLQPVSAPPCETRRTRLLNGSISNGSKSLKSNDPT